MDFSKIKKISFILLILFILLFPFWCVRGLCAEGNLLEDYSCFNGTLHTATGSNVVYYYPLIEGREYTVEKTDSFGGLSYCGIFYSTSIEDGSTTTLLKDFMAVNSYTFVAPENGYILVSSSNVLSLDMINFLDSSESMEKTVSQLTDNVGINQIWNIFDTSINYIVVVVLFAFGAYIIFRIIRKISRGKEGL